MLLLFLAKKMFMFLFRLIHKIILCFKLRISLRLVEEIVELKVKLVRVAVHRILKLMLVLYIRSVFLDMVRNKVDRLWLKQEETLARLYSCWKANQKGHNNQDKGRQIYFNKWYPHYHEWTTNVHLFLERTNKI